MAGAHVVEVDIDAILRRGVAMHSASAEARQGHPGTCTAAPVSTCAGASRASRGQGKGQPLRSNASGYRYVGRRVDSRGRVFWDSRLTINRVSYGIAHRADPAKAAAMAEEVARLFYDDEYKPPPYRLPQLSARDRERAIAKVLYIMREIGE